MSFWKKALLFPLRAGSWLYSGLLYLCASIITLSVFAAIIYWFYDLVW